MKLSKRFEEKWIKVMGFRPDAEVLDNLVKEAICIQKGRRVQCGDKEIDRIPTIKWDYKRGIVYLIDEQKEKLITFYVG